MIKLVLIILMSSMANAELPIVKTSAQTQPDNLGNHVATTTLNMGSYGINTSSNVTAYTGIFNGKVGISTNNPVASFELLGVGRINSGTSPNYPTSGAGFEMIYDADGKVGSVSGGSGLSYFVSYDRTSSAYKDIQFNGADILFNTVGTGKNIYMDADNWHLSNSTNLFYSADDSVGAAVGMRQNNAVAYGFDWKLDTLVNGDLYLDRVVNSVATNILSFSRSNGNMGIGAKLPTSKLHLSSGTLLIDGNSNQSILANGLITGASIYATWDVSALTFTDRTPYPETLEIAYAEVMSMTRSSTDKRKIDKDKLHVNLRKNLLVPYVSGYDTIYSTITITYDKGVKSEIVDEYKIPIESTKIEIGRDLSATVSAQNEVIKDLIKRIEALEAK